MSINYETLQIRTEKIAQKAVFLKWHFLSSQKYKNVKILLSLTFPPPYFSSQLFKTFVTDLPNINQLDTVVTPTLSSDPDTSLKIWNVHWRGAICSAPLFAWRYVPLPKATRDLKQNLIRHRFLSDGGH